MTNINQPRIEGGLYIAKGMHHASAAAFYFEHCIIELGATHGAKALFKDCAKRCKSAVNLIISEVKNEETKKILKDELQDQLAVDALTDSYLILNNENRAKAEEYLVELARQQREKPQQ